MLFNKYHLRSFEKAATFQIQINVCTNEGILTSNKGLTVTIPMRNVFKIK